MYTVLRVLILSRYSRSKRKIHLVLYRNYCNWPNPTSILPRLSNRLIEYGRDEFESVLRLRYRDHGRFSMTWLDAALSRVAVLDTGWVAVWLIWGADSAVCRSCLHENLVWRIPLATGENRDLDEW